MTAAYLLGIKPHAQPAWLALGAALERIADKGRRPVCCTRPDQWSADAKPAARRDAAEACTFCPAMAACRAFAEANRERFGVFGGVDFTATGRATGA